MKRISTTLLLAGAIVFGAVLPVLAQSGSGTCRLGFHMLNSTRHVVGEVNTECSWPRWPNGNWGVESNYGNRENGFQFAGWIWEDNLLQWQSCTRDFARDWLPCPSRYNHDHNGNGLCEDQGSDAEYRYAGFSVDFNVGCPFDSNYDGQCDTAS